MWLLLHNFLRVFSAFFGGFPARWLWQMEILRMAATAF
ncbi:hypothetical protein LINPERHAP1_LOCUS13635 [Linum perenne]